MRPYAPKILAVVLAAVVGLGASSCPPRPAQPTVQPPPPPRPEEPPTARASCGTPVKQCQTVVDCTNYGGCIAATCVDGTCQYAPEVGAGCECIPGSCSPDGGRFCNCGWQDQTLVSSRLEQCPSDLPACRDGACRCIEDTFECTGGWSFRKCVGGAWVEGQCPSDKPRCEGGACRCDPKAGTPCSHCGTWQCDGTCSQADPPGYGGGCGCGLKGKIGCDGSCAGGDCPPGESCVNGACRRPCVPYQGMECGCARKGHYDCSGRCAGDECPRGEECAPDNSQCVCKKPTIRCSNGKCCSQEKCCGDFCCGDFGRCCTAGGEPHCIGFSERCHESER